MNPLNFAQRSLLLVALMSLSAQAGDSREGGLVELWDLHDALVEEVVTLTGKVDTSTGDIIATRALLDETRIQLTDTGSDLTEAAQLLTVLDDNLSRVETATLSNFVPVFESFRRDYSQLITDPILFSASSLRQGEIVELNPSAVMDIMLQAADVWDSLQSNEVIAYWSIDDEWLQASNDFRSALAEIQTALDAGQPVDVWEELVKARAVYPHGDWLNQLFYVFKESIEQQNDDKLYLLERLEMLNQISDSLSEYLETLGQLNGLVRERMVAQWIEDPDP